MWLEEGLDGTAVSFHTGEAYDQVPSEDLVVGVVWVIQDVV